MDFRTTRVSAGSGGDGCVAFLRLLSKEFAGPSGGDGGNGGHIVLRGKYCEFVFIMYTVIVVNRFVYFSADQPTKK